MRTWLLYGTIALLTFIGILVAYAPASLAWNLIKEDVDRAVPDLELLTVDGSIWAGKAQLRYREFPPAELLWSIHPASLAGLTVALDATLRGDGLLATGSGERGSGLASIDATGHIDSSYINPVSTRYGLAFPGRLDIEALSLAFDNAWFTAADGTLSWNGGTVVIENFQGRQVLELPPLVGDLSLDERNLKLNVTSEGATLIDVTLKPNGWAVVDMKARLLDIAGLPVRADVNPDVSAIVIEEKLF